MAALSDRRPGLSARQALAIVLLLGMGALAFRLGIWQIDRAEQKSALARMRAEARSAEPIILAQLEASAVLGAVGRHLVVPPGRVPQRVAGSDLPAGQTRAAGAGTPGHSPVVPDAIPSEPGPATWYLDNRTHKGTPGVHVLAVLPLSQAGALTTGTAALGTDSGAARGGIATGAATSPGDSAAAPGAVPGLAGHFPNRPDHVLLLRGWQPKDPQYPQGIRPGGKMRGDVQVVVRVESLADTRRAAGGVGKGVAGDQPWHWLGIDPEEMGHRAGISLLPVLLRQLEDARDLSNSRVDDGLVRDWVEPSEGVDKHRAYAFQWFLLFGLCVVLALGLAWRSLRPSKETPGAPNG